MSDAPRIVIIGAGVAGLSAGIALAEAGWQVRILEQHTIPGGLLQRYRRAGVDMDSGFHFVTAAQPGGTFRRILRFLGIRDRITFTAMDSNAQIRLHIPGCDSFDLPVGIDRTEAVLAERHPQQRDALVRFFQRMRRQLGVTPWLADLADGSLDESLRDHQSVESVFNECGIDAEVARELGAYPQIIGLHARNLGFTTFSLICGTAMAGCWRIVDGGGALTTALVERFTELGGELHCRRSVEHIDYEGRHCRAVIDQRGERYEAEWFLGTCHPAELLRIGGSGAFRPMFSAAVEECADSTGGFGLVGLLENEVSTSQHCHHFIQSDDGASIYVVFPHHFDGGPPRYELVKWIPTETVGEWRASRIGKRPPAYEAWKREQVAQTLTACEDYFPGLTQAVGRSWSWSPLTVRDYTRSRHGAALGLAHDLDNLGGTPLSPRGRLRNLLLAGQNIGHPGIFGSTVGSLSLVGMMLSRDLASEVAACDGE